MVLRKVISSRPRKKHLSRLCPGRASDQVDWRNQCGCLHSPLGGKEPQEFLGKRDVLLGWCANNEAIAHT